MINTAKDNEYTFAIKNDSYGMFFAKDGHIEIYDEKNPAHTGFIFNDFKRLTVFINNLTDAAELRQIELNKKETEV